jgi:hypothetical protein
VFVPLHQHQQQQHHQHQLSYSPSFTGSSNVSNVSNVVSPKQTPVRVSIASSQQFTGASNVQHEQAADMLRMYTEVDD